MASEAVKFIPDHASVYFNVANILGKKGKYEQAEAQYKLAISKNPTDPIIYANLGISRIHFTSNSRLCIYKIIERRRNTSHFRCFVSSLE